jgi:hypothetical protein
VPTRAPADPLGDGLPRLDGPIVLDGRPDEPAWRTIPLLPVVEQWPRFGPDRSARTRLRVAHDGESLWIAAELIEDPAAVRGQSLQRDRQRGDDAVEVVVDATNDDATALQFTTTPLGVRVDSEIRNDATPTSGIEPINMDWNGFWEARSALGTGGWSTEMRIPLEVLGVRPVDGRAVIGLLVSRYFAGTTARDIFPAVPPDWPMSAYKPSLARDVVLSGVEVGRSISVTPYLLTGVDRTRPEEAGPGSVLRTSYPLEMGGDVRVGLAAGVSLDLTANTDFAQVESDELLVNLDRFNLFRPEKRQFFQERSATFESSLGPDARLFHSRTIGIDDEGVRRTIHGGARLTGVTGPWDFGALTLQVAPPAGGGPAENDAVVRVSRVLAGGRARVGALATGRFFEGGDRDLTAGADALVQLAAAGALTFQAGWTASTGDAGSPTASAPANGDASVVRLLWERRRTQGLGWAVEGVRAGPAFRPSLGYLAREPFTSTALDLTHGWRPSGGAVRTVTGILTTRAYWSSADGRFESGLQRFRAQMLFSNGLFWNTAVNLTHETLGEPLDLPGATVPAGTYRGVDVFTSVWLNEAWPVAGSATVYVGRAFDGWRTEVRLAPTVSLPPHLSISPTLVLNRLRFPIRGEVVKADALGLRLALALDTRFGMDALVQYNRAVERLAGNVRLRAHLGEGRDVFLVYDGVSDRGTLDEERAYLGRADGRVLLKVTHALRW